MGERENEEYFDETLKSAQEKWWSTHKMMDFLKLSAYGTEN